MRPSDDTPEAAANAAATESVVRGSAHSTTAAETPRFAFARDTVAPQVHQVNGNVAAVLHFLATVMYDPENRIALDPLAADGLCHILNAARHDLLDAAERPGR